MSIQKLMGVFLVMKIIIDMTKAFIQYLLVDMVLTNKILTSMGIGQIPIEIYKPQ